MTQARFDPRKLCGPTSAAQLQSNAISDPPAGGGSSGAQARPPLRCYGEALTAAIEVAATVTVTGRSLPVCASEWGQLRAFLTGAPRTSATQFLLKLRTR